MGDLAAFAQSHPVILVLLTVGGLALVLAPLVISLLDRRAGRGGRRDQ